MHAISARFTAFVTLLFIAACGAFLAVPAAAQKIAPPPRPDLRPQLVISSAVDIPVRMQQVSVRGEVSGNLAVTEISMVFYNPNRRILEGELQFPLLDGQNVIGFAMDVNGRMRDAVPVEKARGQAVFEDITRGQIDPGLLQVTQGNNFKLRVYPIPAQGTRQVLIRYAQTLAERDGRAVYRLPLEYAQTLDSFALDIFVGGAAATPVTRNPLEGLHFASTGNGFRAQVARDRYAGRGLLEIEIPLGPGTRAYTQIFDAKTFFYAEVPVRTRVAPRALPSIVGVIWDSSGSGATRDHAREFALLDAYFRRMRNGEVRLTRVRDTAEAPQSFRVVDGDWRALRAALEATPYDGATNLGAFTPDATVREYLLFSDGLSNFGEAAFSAGGVPVYAISASNRADPALLKRIAETSRARFIDLIGDSAQEAAGKLLSTSTRISAADADGVSQLVMPTPYPSGGRFAIAGQMTETTARLRLTVEHPGAKPATIEVPVRAQQSPSALAALLWARLRIESLEAQRELNRAEIRRIGNTFRIVTRDTSLIILDRIEDYVRYEITPPQELMAEYERLRLTAIQRRGTDRSAHLENIVRRYDEKIAWWNRDFPKGAKIAPAAKALRPEADVRGMMERPREDSPARDRAAPGAPAPAPAMRQNQLGASASEARSASAAPAQSEIVIKLKKWEPDAAYASRLRDASRGEVYRVYLDEKPSYANSTAFFLDSADILFDKEEPALAVRVLTNLAEMDLENRHILRILGYRLLQAQQPKLAIPVFRKVLELAPEEPQSYRDLGLALAADRRFQQAVDTLYQVVVRPWHGRFPDVELITLAELNAIVATAGEKLDTSRIDPRLLKNLTLDVRAVLTWDADNTDIDLWVTDPNNEKAYYGHRLTFQGGAMSRDFTGGYGPEEFSLKNAKPGKYKIEAQYYGDRRQAVTGPTTLQVKLGIRFGTAEQKEQLITLRLKAKSEVVYVGEFEVKG